MKNPAKNKLNKLGEILSEEGYSKETIKTYVNQGQHILHNNNKANTKNTWLVRRAIEKKMLETNLIDKEVLVKVNKSKVNREAIVRNKVLCDRDIQTIFQSMDKLKSRHKYEYRLAMELSLASGIRLAEVFSLQREDVVLNTNHPHIVIKSGKGNKFRIAFLINPSSWLMDRLVCFDGFNCTRRGLELALIRLSKGLGIHFSFHSFRHTFATRLAEKGKRLEIIQAQLGHSDIHTTQIYAKITPKALENGLFN